MEVDRIEQIWEGARDVQDIARDLKKRDRLQSYTGEDEVTQNGHQRVEVHVHQHSQPDSDPPEQEPSVEVGPLKVRNLPRWATGAIVVAGIVLAAITAAASKLLAK